MTLRLVSPGAGPVRDLIVVYHYDGRFDDLLRKTAPEAVIYNETGPDFKGHYRRAGNGGLLPIRDLIERARRDAGPFDLRWVIAAGFSEGCQGPRAQLLHGEEIDAIIACDGTHASRVPLEAEQITPWRTYADRARRSERLLLLSHTRIQPPNAMSTRDVLRLVTGWPLDTAPAHRNEGRLFVYSYPGTDAEAHCEQARDHLPRMIAEALAILRKAQQEADASCPSNAVTVAASAQTTEGREGAPVAQELIDRSS